MNSHSPKIEKSASEPGEWTGPRPSLLTLVLLAAASPMAMSMFVPSMPGIAVDLDVSYATIQLGVSLYLAVMAALQLVIGPLSDLYGRRPIIFVGLVLSLVGTAMCIFASSATVFLAGRVVQAASVSGMVLARAIVRDVYPRAKAASAMGYMVMAMAVAPMVGPAIGGKIDEWFGWRMSFVVLFGFIIISIVATLVTLPETNRFRGAPLRDQVASYRALSAKPMFWLYAASAGLASATFFGFIGGGPAVSVDFYELTPSGYGLYFAICAFGYSSGNFLTGRFSERRGLERMMLDGVLISFAGPVIAILLYLAGVIHPAALFVPIALVGFGNGLTLPNATTAAVSLKPDAAGAASGLLGAMQIGIGAAASSIAAIIVGEDAAPVPLCLFLAGCALAAIFVTRIAVRAGRQSATAP